MRYAVRCSVIGFLLSGAVSMGAASAAGPAGSPGLWEVTMTSTMEMEGMQMAMPPVTRRHCVTAEDLVPKAGNPGQECRIDDQQTGGNTVSWRMSCDTPQGPMTGKGEMTYSGDTYSGTFVMNMPGGDGRPGTMKQTLKGRRVGDCK